MSWIDFSYEIFKEKLVSELGWLVTSKIHLYIFF